MKEFYHEEKVRNRYILSLRERKIRREFVRKVNLITAGQLFFTTCTMISISFHSGARDYLNARPTISSISVILMAVFTMFLVFCSWLARYRVVNHTIFISLTTFTSFWMTCLCVQYTHAQVGTAIIITIILVFVLGLFAMYTTRDFTVLLGVLLVITLFAISMGCVFFFWPNPQLKWAIMIGSVMLTCVYFLSDVQMVISGDRTFFLDMESYVLGACIMYIDFVYFFIYVLMIAGDIMRNQVKW